MSPLRRAHAALEQGWARLNDLCANPWVAVGAIAFVCGWTAKSWLSHGKFDPGLTVGTFIQTTLQTVLVFVTASVASGGARHAREHRREATERHTAATSARDAYERHPATAPTEKQSEA